MKWNFLVILVLILLVLLGCAPKTSTPPSPAPIAPTPAAPSVKPVLPTTELSKPTLTPASTPTPTTTPRATPTPTLTLIPTPTPTLTPITTPTLSPTPTLALIEKLEESKYEIEQQIILKNDGPNLASKVALRVALITTREPYQRVVSTKISPEKYNTVSDDYGNIFAEFEFSDIFAGKDVSVRINYQVAASKLRYSLGSYEERIPVRFLEAERWIESKEGEIVALSQQLTSDKPSSWEKARAIYDWIGGNISYTGYYPKSRGALFALRNRSGDCSEFSDLLIALCRAAGIPARTLNGVTKENASSAAETHDWAEVYLSGTGWVPVDPTWGRFREKQAQYFAGMTADHIIVTTGKNLDLLGGFFNFYYTWQRVGGKTEVSGVQGWQIRKVK